MTKREGQSLHESDHVSCATGLPSRVTDAHKGVNRNCSEHTGVVTWAFKVLTNRDYVAGQLAGNESTNIASIVASPFAHALVSVLLLFLTTDSHQAAAI